MSSLHRNSESESICGRGEVERLSTMGKIRLVNKPKCRLKFILLIVCISVALVLVGAFVLIPEEAEVFEEPTVKELKERHYSGKLSLKSKESLQVLPCKTTQL